MGFSIIYLGSNGFPEGQAGIRRQAVISKLLVDSGSEVLVVSRKGVNKVKSQKIRWRGIYHGVKYVFTSLTPFYPKNYFLRNFLKGFGFITESLLLVVKRIENRNIIFLVNTINVNDLKWYRFLSRLLGVPLVYDLVEWIDDLPISKGRNKHFMSLLLKQADGIICISSLLSKHLEEKGFRGPLFRLPSVSSFKDIDAIPVSIVMDRPYFLFCGSASYTETIKMILDAFILLADPKLNLIMVINGNKEEMMEFRQLLGMYSPKSNIEHKENLDYKALIQLYKSATALLIPLNHYSRLERARFPHKISEYCAAGRPIITTPIDEVNAIFMDQESALIAEEWSPAAIISKMSWVIRNPKEATEIGRKGREVGQKFLDIDSYRTSLPEYLSKFR